MSRLYKIPGIQDQYYKFINVSDTKLGEIRDNLAKFKHFVNHISVCVTDADRDSWVLKLKDLAMETHNSLCIFHNFLMQSDIDFTRRYVSVFSNAGVYER